jgi:hypothetical protein
MSGLSMRSHMNAGQDGFRDKGSKLRIPTKPPGYTDLKPPGVLI